MYFFYNLQPPQAKIINPYQPILDQNKSKFIRTSSYDLNNNQYNQSLKNNYNCYENNILINNMSIKYIFY